MDVDGVPTRTIRADPELGVVEVIDQTLLPHEYRWIRLADPEAAAHAIRSMQVRGAPLIGVTAAYGLALAAAADPRDEALDEAAAMLLATRPTAVNLRWAVTRMRSVLASQPPGERAGAGWALASAMAEEDVAANRAIGSHGLELLRSLPVPDGRPLSVMTHCNAGWLATVDHGTALSPVYAAVAEGIPVHVWVSETRPRNQGLLTAWELARHGVPHTVVADSAAGPLLRQGRVDAVIVGADRVAANGDVANKIGTYLKALACRDSGVPCYVAAPGSTIDFACPSGDGIPIEERSGDEVRLVRGLPVGGVPVGGVPVSGVPVDGAPDGVGGPSAVVRQLPVDEGVHNPAFDVTPARLVTALITERGVCAATADGLRSLFPATVIGAGSAG